MFLALGLGTTAAKTSFFGSLQAVVCAGRGAMGDELKIGTLAAAALAVTGVAARCERCVGVLELAGSGPLELAPGDLICSLVPLSFGAGWFILGKTMKDYPEDALPSTALQLALICLACLGWTGASSFHQGGLEAVAAVFAQLPSLLLTPNLLPPLLFSALVGNVLTMWLANEALRRVKGADVALIAASEPLWAALAGIAFLGDVLHPHEVVGGALLIAAVVCNELWAEEELPLESPARRRESAPVPRQLVQMAAMKDK
ncbi:unnamed protein product [Effrenium voratum]|nr:unnamed protein product [Effrenium voratum]